MTVDALVLRALLLRVVGRRQVVSQTFKRVGDGGG